MDDEEATWEDYDSIRVQFPGFLLEDKSGSEKGGVSAMALLKLGVAVRKESNGVKGVRKSDEKGRVTKVGLIGPNNPIRQGSTNQADKVKCVESSPRRLTGDGSPNNSAKEHEGLKGSYSLGDHVVYKCVLSIGRALESPVED